MRSLLASLILVALMTTTAVANGAGNNNNGAPVDPCVAALEAINRANAAYRPLSGMVDAAFRDQLTHDQSLTEEQVNKLVALAHRAAQLTIAKIYLQLPALGDVASVSVVRMANSGGAWPMSTVHRFGVMLSYTPSGVALAEVDFDINGKYSFNGSLQVIAKLPQAPVTAAPAAPAIMDAAAIAAETARAYGAFGAAIEQGVRDAIAQEGAADGMPADVIAEYQGHAANQAADISKAIVARALQGAAAGTVVTALAVSRVAYHEFMSMSAMGGGYAAAVTLSSGVTKHYYAEQHMTGHIEIREDRP